MTVPNQFEIFVENLSKKGWASTAPRETLSTSPHQPLHSLMSMLPAALHFRGMYFSTGRNTSSRCTQSLLNLSPNQHTGAKHDNGLLLTNCCAYPHNGGEKILCLFGDWLAMRNEKCNPDTTTKIRRLKRRDGLESLWNLYHWGILIAAQAKTTFSGAAIVMGKVSAMNSLSGSLPSVFCGSKSFLFSETFKMYLHTRPAMHWEFQKQAAHQVNAFSTDCLVCISVPSS